MADNMNSEIIPANLSVIMNNISNSVPGILLACNLDYQIIYTNPYTIRLLKYKKDKIFHQSIFRIFPLSNQIKKEMKININNQKNFRIETYAYKGNKKKLNVQLNVAPLIVNKNLEGIVIIAFDLIGNPLMEEILKKSQEKFKNILTNMSEGYYEVDMSTS